jgi:DNA polymerase-3 subunit gamma/tau
VEEESEAAPAAKDPAQGAAQVRQMWPQILDAVKNRRRFTWILLSQNAQVVGFDGTTLQLGFSNAGARDSFAGGGSEDVLVQALGDALGVQWKVEAIIDPSGGMGSGTGGAGPSGGSGSGSGFGGGFGGGGSGSGNGGFGGGGGSSEPSSPTGSSGTASPGGQGAAAGARAAMATAQAAPQSGVSVMAGASSPETRAAVPGQSGQSSRAEQASAAPYSGGLEDDMPAEDDPDLDESALSGHDLIMRELGATVIEEFDHQ